MFRIQKIITSLAYLALIWLTWQWFKGDSQWGFSFGCILVSGLWLVLTGIELRSLFSTYFDVFSRLRAIVPAVIGGLLAGLAVTFADPLALKIVAGVELVLWLAVLILYRRNRQQYIRQGRGPLPKDAWINPDAGAIRDMDLILTSGAMAARLQESVGHGEVAVTMPDGKLYLLSSYMEKGTVLSPVERVTTALRRKGQHYIVLRLNAELSEAQKDARASLVEILRAQNKAYCEQARAARQRRINALPLPSSVKSWLIRKLPVTGYDWIGLLIGTRHRDHWTCVGICLEFYHRLGIKTNEYGTGLLGLGTGLLNPIMPVRFLSDPAFRLLTQEDKVAFEGREPQSALPTAG